MWDLLRAGNVKRATKTPSIGAAPETAKQAPTSGTATGPQCEYSGLVGPASGTLERDGQLTCASRYPTAWALPDAFGRKVERELTITSRFHDRPDNDRQPCNEDADPAHLNPRGLLFFPGPFSLIHQYRIGSAGGGPGHGVAEASGSRDVGIREPSVTAASPVSRAAYVLQNDGLTGDARSKLGRGRIDNFDATTGDCCMRRRM